MTTSKSKNRNLIEVETLKINGAESKKVIDFLSVEEPLEIHVAGCADGEEFSRTISVTLRTPGADEELALGFLFSEGIISGLSDVQNVWTRDCNFFCVTLADEVRLKEEAIERHSFMNSSCGVCGKKSIEAVMQRRMFHAVESSASVQAEMISTLPGKLQTRQSDFESTGGIHACALFDFDGNLIAVREDIGRHNAVDKLIGSRLMQDKLPLAECILLLSGRASFELIQKAACAGIPFVAAVGAPSSLAVELAKDCEMTLLGFVRDDRFNVYSGAHRFADV